MSTNYPSAQQTFTNPTISDNTDSPNHATQHATENDTIVAIETVLGTTGGTSILKSFVAGQFPARTNVGGTIVQTLIGGTINNTILGTPAITGGTANNQVMGTPTLTLGSDAQGDTFFRSAGGTVNRLAPGTSGQYLKTQGAGSDPIWGNPGLTSKLITSTRDMTLASGDVAYTGVGFTPTSIIAIGAGASSGGGAVGFSDSSKTAAEWDELVGVSEISSNLLLIQPTSGNAQSCIIKSYDADGFTLTWTKIASPTGTSTLAFLCFK